MISLNNLITLLDAKKSGNKFIACCPAHDDQNPSLSIDKGINCEWVVHCHAGCSQDDVVKAILNLAEKAPQSKGATNLKRNTRSSWFDNFDVSYSEAVEYNKELKTPLRLYFEGRGLDGDLIPKSVRYHSSLSYHEGEKHIGDFHAALFPITLNGTRTGIQRIYLSSDGNKAEVPAPKKVLGSFKDGAAIFFDGEDIDVAVIAEGPETTLALREASGLPGISTVSDNGMKNLVLPKKVKTVFICADLDKSGAGQKAARQLAKRLYEEGRAVHLLYPNGPIPDNCKGVDFLDELNSKGPTHIKHKIENARSWKPITKGQKEFVLEPLGKLLSEPDEEHDWVVDGLFVKSGISICAGKPKAGKTTLTRQLALCVATGNPFLGFTTEKGRVLYLALEEKRNEVKKHFQLMGATGEEEIFIHAAAAPQDAVNQLSDLIDIHRPILIIIDPLFRFTRVGNSNDYSEVTNALEDVVALARETDAHILLVHHMGKTDREGADGILGSTAIFGAVDTAIMMNRTEAFRTIKTVQRYGTDIEERILEFDLATKTMSLGAEKSEAIDEKMAEKVLDFLKKKKRPCNQTEIVDNVPGQKIVKTNALKFLVQSGRVKKEGQGKKGKAFLYSYIEESEFSGPDLEGGTEDWNLDDYATGENL